MGFCVVKARSVLFFLAIAVIFSTSCKDTGVKTIQAPPADAQGCIKAERPVESAVANPQAVKLYVDVSMSMKGYFMRTEQESDSDFVYSNALQSVPEAALKAFSLNSVKKYKFADQIVELRRDPEFNALSALHAYVEPENGQRGNRTARTASPYDCPDPRAPCISRTSEIQRPLLESVAASDTLSVIATDLFISSKWPLDQGNIVLAPMVRALKNGLAVGIFGMKNPFHGLIYDLPVSGRYLHNGSHPVYFIIVGRLEHVARFYESLIRTLDEKLGKNRFDSRFTIFSTNFLKAPLTPEMVASSLIDIPRNISKTDRLVKGLDAKLQYLVSGKSNFIHVRDEHMAMHRTVAEVSLAGLIYYIGQVVKWLSGPELKLFNMDVTPLYICIGGRGSLIYRYLFGTAGFNQTMINCERLFKEVTKFDRNMEFKISERPKHEVAYGLLVDPSGRHKFNIKVASKGMIPGEEIHRESNAIAPGFSIEEQIHPRETIEVKELIEFKKFLNCYRKFFQHLAPFNDLIHDNLVSFVNDELSDDLERICSDEAYKARAQAQIWEGTDQEEELPKDGQTLRMEPAFIITLKKYLHDLPKLLAEQAERQSL